MYCEHRFYVQEVKEFQSFRIAMCNFVGEDGIHQPSNTLHLTSHDFLSHNYVQNFFHNLPFGTFPIHLSHIVLSRLCPSAFAIMKPTKWIQDLTELNDLIF